MCSKKNRFDAVLSLATDLLRREIERAEHQTTRTLARLGFRRLIIVEDVQEHASQQQHETARASLHTCETVRRRTREDREPQVTFGHTVICLLRQQVRELALLRLASHRQHTFHLHSTITTVREAKRRGLTVPSFFSTASQFWQMK